MLYYSLMYELFLIWIGISLNCAAVKKLTCKIAVADIIFLMYGTLNRKKNNRIFLSKFHS